MCRQWSIRRWSSLATNDINGSFKELDEDTKFVLESVKFNVDEYEYEKSACQPPSSGTHVTLSLKFITGVLLLTSAVAYTVGSVACVVLLAKFDTFEQYGPDAQSITIPDCVPVEEKSTSTSHQLPAPIILPGKEVPFTTYTSKSFQVAGVSSSDTVHIDRRTDTNNDEKCAQDEQTAEEKNMSAYFEDDDLAINDYSHNDDSDGLHLPAGQHLLVDLKNVDSEFLNDETRLAEAMIELTTESKLTLLSYHCHGLVPMGVSCAGVLLESHVAFHTWPDEGVITMDLFTCGGNPLIPILPTIQRLFGVPQEPNAHDENLLLWDDSAVQLEAYDEPEMVWSHKLRGFREGFAAGYSAQRNPLDQDLGRYILGSMKLEMKEEIVSSKTDFQTVDVYDVMDPRTRNVGSYLKSLQDDQSYESNHPEQFAPDRVLFLDGVIQSTLMGDAPYHESIVHPAMITHPNPRRVAIIGGGEGATLREVLKHKTVEEAVMIEIDEGVVDLSKQHLSEWQDCSSIAHHDGRAKWCFDDIRVRSRFEDAMAYFIDNFTLPKAGQQVEEVYDVIIMDALDPNDEIEFAVYLYTSDNYIQSLYNALSDQGILVVQVGEVPDVIDPADETGHFANRSIMKDKLSNVGFESIHVYEEGHSGFLAPWSTLVAFKDAETRKNWYRNNAEIDLQLQKRILSTSTGTTSLRNFDGATMKQYQLPPRAFETIYRRREGFQEDCDGLETCMTFNNKTSIGYNPVFERRFASS